MPPIEGQEEGSKQAFIWSQNGELIIQSLEAARTDWTPLAKAISA